MSSSETSASLTHEMNEARDNIRQGLQDQAVRYLEELNKKLDFYQWALKAAKEAGEISDPEFIADLQAHIQVLTLSAHSMKHMINSS